LVTQIESQLMPLWVRRSIDTIEAELVAERSRREAAERRDRTLRDQIRKEAEAQQQLHAELDDARHQLEQLTARYQATDSEGARAAARKTTELSEKLEVSEAKRKELEQTSEELGRRLRVLENELRDARAAQSAAPRPGVGVGAEQSSPIPSYAQPVITRTSSQTATALKAAALASAFSGVVFLALAVSNLSSSYYYDFESGYGWTMKLGWVLSCIPMAVAIAKRQMALGRMWVGPCLAVPVTWIAAGSFFAGLPESFPDILAWPRTFGIAAFIGGGAAAGIAQRDVFSSSGIGKCALVGGFYIAGHLAWIVIPRVLWGITFTDLVYDHPWGTMTAFGATFAFAGHVALAFVILSEVPQQASSQSTVSLFS
jgi:hypothetical protein